LRLWSRIGRVASPTPVGARPAGTAAASITASVASRRRRARATAGVVFAHRSVGTSTLTGRCAGSARRMPVRSSPPSPGTLRSQRAWNSSVSRSPGRSAGASQNCT